MHVSVMGQLSPLPINFGVAWIGGGGGPYTDINIPYLPTSLKIEML